MLEHSKEFLHKHPVESVLLGGVGVIALYLAFKPASNSGASQEAALQNAYFQAESIQAQSNAAVQVAGITTSAQTAQTQIAANVATTNATTYANEATAITASNNNTAVAALPYAEESNLIAALTSITGQTQTVQKSSGGFFGIGASNKAEVTPTPAATSAASYLQEIVNGLYASH